MLEMPPPPASGSAKHRGKRHCNSPFHPQHQRLLSSQKAYFQVVAGPKVYIILDFNHVA